MPTSEPRRRFLLDSLFASTLLAPAAAAADSTLLEPWGLVTRRYRVPIRNLPPSLHNLRLVQLSDTHLGPNVPAWAIQRAVQLAADLNPDVILLTGDYIHAGESHIDEAAQLFAPLLNLPNRPPVLAVLGNHDWYGNAPRMAAALTRLGVRMIDNDRLFFCAKSRTLLENPRDHAHAADCLCFAGVGDLDEDHVDLPRALRDVPHHTPRILLSHNPDVAELPYHRFRTPTSNDAPAPRIDLQLSGHTHGGQIRLPLLGAPIVPSAYNQKYAGGLVRSPHWPTIVSRGVGMSILPVRLNCPPEVVEVTLLRA